MVSPVPFRFSPFVLFGRGEIRDSGVTALKSDTDSDGSSAENLVNSDGSVEEHSTTELGVDSSGGIRRWFGHFRLGDCVRLAPLLADSVASVHEEQGSVKETLCQFSFQLIPWEQYMMAKGRLSTTLQLQCQRCLERFDYPVDHQFELVMVPDQAAADKLSEELDPVILDDDGMITLIDLFEDELILQVPTVPKHATTDACQFAVPVIVEGSREDQELAVQASDVEGRKNPFDALKALKFDQ